MEFPILIFIAYVASVLVDSTIPASEAKGLYWFLPLIFFSVLFTGGPLTEELGWRGYALPRLQAKYSPFVSTLILGFIWSSWHFPQFIVPPKKTGMFYITPMWSFIFTVIAANFVYTWVFNHTNGSILAVILLPNSNEKASPLNKGGDESIFYCLYTKLVFAFVSEVWYNIVNHGKGGVRVDKAYIISVPQKQQNRARQLSRCSGRIYSRA